MSSSSLNDPQNIRSPSPAYSRTILGNATDSSTQDLLQRLPLVESSPQLPPDTVPAGFSPRSYSPAARQPPPQSHWQPQPQHRQHILAPLPLPAPVQHPLPLPSIIVSPAPAATLLPHSSSDAAAMSAVAALQFDPVFGMGSRATYSSWPVIDSNHGLLDHDLSCYASDTSLSPPAASRSFTASPPRHNVFITPQQRELKRQREQARRDARLAARRSRAGSLSVSPLPRSAIPAACISASGPSAAGPVHGSPSFQSSPAATMADLSASSTTGGLPGIYTTSAPSQMSLLSDAVTTSGGLASPSYMATGGAYSSSVHDHAHQGVFSAPYPNHSYLPEYTTASFTGAAPATLHSQYPRAAMHDQNMMYHMPPPQAMMGTGPIHQQSHHSQLPHPHMAAAHHSLAAGQPSHRPHQHAHHHQHSPPLQHAHAHGVHSSNGSGSSNGNSSSSNGNHYDNALGSLGSAGAAGVRVVQGRPKPQCWEHGCNGRQFSTFSNLLRHQREKSGQATKSVCPNCGAEFTRTTARNGHMQHDKCKQRRST